MPPRKEIPETDYWAEMSRRLCTSPYHKPPMHMVYRPGPQEHRCSSCGLVTRWFQSSVIL